MQYQLSVASFPLCSVHSGSEDLGAFSLSMAFVKEQTEELAPLDFFSPPLEKVVHTPSCPGGCLSQALAACSSEGKGLPGLMDAYGV